MTSPAVTAVAAKRLGSSTQPGDVAGRVTASAGQTGATLEITGSGASGTEAARVTKVVTDSYIAVLGGQIRRSALLASQRLQAEYTRVQGELAALPAPPPSAPDAAAVPSPRLVLQQRLQGVSEQLARLSADAALFDTGVQVTRPATAPATPVSPHPLKDALLAALIGAVAAGVIAWGAEIRAHRRTDLGRVARLLGVPGLGRVPPTAAGAAPASPRPRPASASAADGGSRPWESWLGELDSESSERPGLRNRWGRLWGRVRWLGPRADGLVRGRHRDDGDRGTPPAHWQLVVSSVDAALRKLHGRSVLIASITRADAASSAAASFAVSAAEDGRCVVLVDADQQSREISAPAGAERAPGLIELVEQNTGLPLSRHPAEMHEPPLVSLLAAGRPVQDSAAFYRRHAFRDTMHALRESADLVVVGAPPVLDSADARVLSDIVDAVVVVVDPAISDDLLTNARERLALADAPLAGFVLLTGSGRRGTRASFATERPKEASRRAVAVSALLSARVRPVPVDGRTGQGRRDVG